MRKKSRREHHLVYYYNLILKNSQVCFCNSQYWFYFILMSVVNLAFQVIFNGQNQYQMAVVYLHTFSSLFLELSTHSDGNNKLFKSWTQCTLIVLNGQSLYKTIIAVHL